MPPRLTGGGRRRPAHLWSQCLEVGVVGGQSGGAAAGRMGTIFLESFVCGGAHTRAVCVCACVSAAEVCRHVCAGKVCVWYVCACATVSPG